jgi:hypothetical protein
MKIFLRIIIGLFVALLLIFAGLSLYLTDERLQKILLPHINEAVGREIEVDKVSFSLFKTFPRFSIVVENMRIPGEEEVQRTESRDTRNTMTAESGRDERSMAAATPGTGLAPTLASMQEMILTVNLRPLLSGNLEVNRLDIDRLNFTYIIFEDGTTNLDSILENMASEEPATENDGSMNIDLQSVTVRNSRIGYTDRETDLTLLLTGLDARMSLTYGDLLVTDIEADVEGLRLVYEGDFIVRNLPVSLRQNSTVDFNNEILTINAGTLNIQGLGLDISGAVSDWSAEAMMLNLALKSSSDDFAALLDMVPDTYKKNLEGVQTSGAFTVDATITGEAGNGLIPDFQALVEVNDGYIKYPGVEKPIEDIQIRMEANNSLISIHRFTAVADVNTLSVNGKINNPLEETADFNLDIDLDMDLSTVERFYPLDGIVLAGAMVINGNAAGEIAKSQEARFNANVRLVNGYVKMPDLDKPVTDMNIVLNATQDLVQIESFSAKAAGNSLSLNGTVTHPLDETRSRFNLTAALDMDLSTIPDFYPLDTDTLDVRGKLTFNGTARGLVAEAENAVLNGQLNLSNGFVKYHLLPKALEEITLRSVVADEKLTISRGSMRTGGNNFSATGDINKFLSDAPDINLLVRGTFMLDEVHEFFDMQPYVNEIRGKAESDLRVSGIVAKPEDLIFNGSLKVSDFYLQSDSLDFPVRDLNGDLVFSNQHVALSSLKLKYGSSDFSLSGQIRHYKRLLENDGPLAELRASFSSNKLNVDEIYEYEPLPIDAPKEAFPIELPRINSVLDVDIKELIFLGISVTDIKGTVASDDKKIDVTGAQAGMFGGRASGSMRWDVPQPDRTKIAFKGGLENVRVEELFKHANPAGFRDAHQFFSGGFSTTIEYATELDVYLDPILETTKSDGNFSMVGATMNNHPTQLRAAEILRSPQLQNLSLDNLLSGIKIENSVMTLSNMNITSRDIGIVLNGTQHLLTDAINYRVTVVLPGTIANNLEPVLTKDGLEALKREDGKVVIPLRITGTTENPAGGLDTEKIQAQIAEYLRTRGTESIRNRLRNLFN